jgi:hypothetical protein
MAMHRRQLWRTTIHPRHDGRSEHDRSDTPKAHGGHFRLALAARHAV